MNSSVLDSTKTYNTFSNDIQTNYLRPSYYKDIKTFIESRFRCRQWGYRLEVVGKILTGLTTMTAFMTGSFPDCKYYNLISGSLGVLAMTCQHLASFSLNRSKESTQQLNETLQSLKIDVSVADVISKDDIDEADQVVSIPPPTNTQVSINTS